MSRSPYEAPGYTIKDSGQRQKFASGMVRDTTAGKTQYRRIFDGPMAERWAQHLTKGATKYPDVKPGVANWTLASGPEEEARFIDSAIRHFVQWLRGDRDEDHAAAVLFNVNGYEYVREKRGADEASNAQAMALLGSLATNSAKSGPFADSRAVADVCAPAIDVEAEMQRRLTKRYDAIAELTPHTTRGACTVCDHLRDEILAGR